MRTGVRILLLLLLMTLISCGYRVNKHQYKVERQTFAIDGFDYKRDNISGVAVDSQEHYLIFGYRLPEDRRPDSTEAFLFVGEPFGDWKRYNLGLGEVNQVFISGPEWMATRINRNNQSAWISTDLISSIDEGKTWKKKYSFPFTTWGIDFLDQKSGYLLAGSYSSHQVWVTNNGGTQWQRVEDESLNGLLKVFIYKKEAFGICQTNDTISFIKLNGLQVEKTPIAIHADAVPYNMEVVEDGLLLNFFSRSSQKGEWIRVRLDNYSLINYPKGYEWVSVESGYWDGQLFAIGDTLSDDNDEGDDRVIWASRDLGKTWQTAATLSQTLSITTFEFYKNKFVGYTDSNRFQVLEFR